jgi:hypothetical protein
MTWTRTAQATLAVYEKARLNGHGWVRGHG